MHLRNVPKGNKIGRSDRNIVGQFGDLGHINQIFGSTDAGIILENCGGAILNTQGRLDDPNLVQNNLVSNCATGLRITGNAQANIIGGEKAGSKGPGLIQITEGLHRGKQLVSKLQGGRHPHFRQHHPPALPAQPDPQQ